MTNACHPSLASPPVPRKQSSILVFGILSCVAGWLANTVPAYFILSLWKIPPGTEIRPMVEAAMIFLGTLGGLVVGLPLAILCLIFGRRTWIGWVLGLCGATMACSPWFISSVLWEWVITSQGFIVKP